MFLYKYQIRNETKTQTTSLRISMFKVVQPNENSIGEEGVFDDENNYTRR